MVVHVSRESYSVQQSHEHLCLSEHLLWNRRICMVSAAVFQQQLYALGRK